MSDRSVDTTIVIAAVALAKALAIHVHRTSKDKLTRAIARDYLAGHDEAVEAAKRLERDAPSGVIIGHYNSPSPYVMNYGVVEMQVAPSPATPIVAGTALSIDPDGKLRVWGIGSLQVKVATMLDTYDGKPTMFVDVARGLAASNINLLLRPR